MTFWFLWILSLIEGGLFFALFYTKNQIIVFPLIILGIIIFSNEVYENLYKNYNDNDIQDIDITNFELDTNNGCLIV